MSRPSVAYVFLSLTLAVIANKALDGSNDQDIVKLGPLNPLDTCIRGGFEKAA